LTWSQTAGEKSPWKHAFLLMGVIVRGGVYWAKSLPSPSIPGSVFTPPAAYVAHNTSILCCSEHYNARFRLTL